MARESVYNLGAVRESALPFPLSGSVLGFVLLPDSMLSSTRPSTEPERNEGISLKPESSAGPRADCRYCIFTCHSVLRGGFLFPMLNGENKPLILESSRYGTYDPNLCNTENRQKFTLLLDYPFNHIASGLLPSQSALPFDFHTARFN